MQNIGLTLILEWLRKRFEGTVFPTLAIYEGEYCLHWNGTEARSSFKGDRSCYEQAMSFPEAISDVYVGDKTIYLIVWRHSESYELFKAEFKFPTESVTLKDFLGEIEDFLGEIER